MGGGPYTGSPTSEDGRNMRQGDLVAQLGRGRREGGGKGGGSRGSSEARESRMRGWHFL